MQTKTINEVDNIATILEYLSVKSKIPIDDLEVKIKSYNTYMKTKDAEFFEVLQDSNLTLIDSDEVFESKDYDFKQSYDIQIYKKTKENNFNIQINNNFESLDLILHKHFIPPKDIDEFDIFIDSINALKATKGILLRKLEDEKEIIQENLLHIHDALKDDLVINLYTSKIFRDSKPSRIKFCINDIDLSKRNIICTKENTLICDFYFAQNGVAGRNMQGIYILSDDRDNKPPTITEDFRYVDDAYCRKYFNIKSGFVMFDENRFSLTQELSFINLQARDNYHFIGDLDSNTTILISTDSEFEDALKSGVSLKAANINISGNIGANTSIQANELTITGQTHKDSTITTNKATINVHKGKLVSNIAKIENLESGSIQSDDLEIVKANGGIISTNNVNINELYSNNTIEFSNKCMVNIMKGGGNKIIFTPLGSSKIRQKILHLQKNLEDIISHQKAINLKAESLIYQYNKYQSTAKDLRDIIKKHKEKNEEIPSYIVQNYQLFLDIVESIKSLKHKNLAIEKEKTQIIQDLKNTQQEIFDAEFICKDGWLKYNDVLFELCFPKVSSSKTIIKGAGRYYFEPKERKIIHQKIFTNTSNQKIDNLGF